MSLKKLLNGEDQPLCFIESFDSVRYAKLAERDVNKRRVQAEIELIYSLLLGRRIVVPEAHSFDSTGFLEIVTDALRTRPRNSDKEWIRYPFILCLRQSYSSYLEMVSSSFSREAFILSALPELNQDISLRRKLAEIMLEEDSFTKIEREMRASNDSRLRFFSQIQELNRYFSEVEKRNARDLGSVLSDYINNLANATNFPDSLMDQPEFRGLREGLLTLIEREVNYTNRSTVRNEGRKYIDDDEIYAGVVEYVDSCYNAVIYKAVGAQTGILTTVESTTSAYVVLAQNLSEESAELGERDQIRISITGNDLLLEKWIRSRESRWEEIWEIMQNDEWISSIRNFLVAGEESQRLAYVAHTKNLQDLTQDSAYFSFRESEELSQEMQAICEGKEIATFEHLFETDEYLFEIDDESDDGYIDGSTPGTDL
jgi:hypothetical protein